MRGELLLLVEGRVAPSTRRRGSESPRPAAGPARSAPRNGSAAAIGPASFRVCNCCCPAVATTDSSNWPCGRRTPCAAANRPSARRAAAGSWPCGRADSGRSIWPGPSIHKPVRAAVEVDVRAGQPQSAALETRRPAGDRHGGVGRGRVDRLQPIAADPQRPLAGLGGLRLEEIARRLRSSGWRRPPADRRATPAHGAVGRRPRTVAGAAVGRRRLRSASCGRNRLSGKRLAPPRARWKQSPMGGEPPVPRPPSLASRPAS